MNDQKFLVIIGPSGTGKTSLVKALRDKNIVHPFPSWTTRPPRPGEQEEAIDHIFASEEEFEKKRKDGFFLESVALFGLPYQYGLPPIDFSADGIAVVLLRAPLIPLLQKHYSNFVIYQIEDSYDRIAKRLVEREKHGEQSGERLKQYEKEIAIGREVANRIFRNEDNIATLAKKVGRAIKEDFTKGGAK